MMQRIYRRTIFLITMLLTLSAALATGQVIPKTDFPKLNERFLVVDSAQVFSEAGRRALEDKLVAYARAQSTQIAVVTIRNLGPYEISQYATEMAHHYGIGQKGKDNGILILFALQNREVNITTGYGTEGRITDGIAGTIIRNDMIPYFKQNKYEAGLTKGAESVMRYLDGEYTNDRKGESEGTAPVFTLIVIIFIVFIVMMVMGKGGKGGRGGGQYMSRRGSDFITGMILGELLRGGRRGGGGWGGGSGGFGGGSSGGFGGFGGGGFGGGGASGSW